ncbi:hypothetical protein BGX31_011628 [Mortierella sp. GBA43]|nr:hypothetical protein BGX31_011628 [Mortierella sp. GBA43]
MSTAEPGLLFTPPLCATPDAPSPSTTRTYITSSNIINDLTLDKTVPTILSPTSPLRRQSIPLMKNGLPIKSAMKRPVSTVDPKNAGDGRPLPVRSHSSPSIAGCKAVHFSAQLEHVRLFLQGEMPSCVADGETIIDAPQGEPSSDIKLTLTNWSPVTNDAFQPVNIDTGAIPLRVENVKLSETQSGLEGTVLIQNIAFHKHVSVRYTVDFWQTHSEVNAEFAQSVTGSALDRFLFKIALDMEKGAKEKTFCFAVRYQVIGREFWDSNNGRNYQVECKRIAVEAPLASSELSKQANTVLAASGMSDYSNPVLKKKTGGRYDWSTSLSATYSQAADTPSRFSSKPDAPMNQTAYRPSEYIMPVSSPPGYHHSLYASSPKFVSSYLSGASPPEHFHIEFDKLAIDQSAASKQGTRNSWEMEPESGFTVKSAPIAIPSMKNDQRPQVGSSSYADFVNHYCFYEPSPHSSPYSSSPAPCIRG